MTQLILLKLPSNQELVGELSASDLDTYTVKSPRFIAYAPDGAGSFNAQLMPYSPIHSEGVYTFRKNDFLSAATDNLPDVLTEMYASSTTGLDFQTGLIK